MIIRAVTKTNKRFFLNTYQIGYSEFSSNNPESEGLSVYLSKRLLISNLNENNYTKC